MTTPNWHSPYAPYLSFTHLDYLASEDLQRHAQRAEYWMNRALDQHQWSLAHCYRDVVRTTRQELDRRTTVDAEPREVG
jgi:hypothetical protein